MYCGSPAPAAGARPVAVAATGGGTAGSVAADYEAQRRRRTIITTIVASLAALAAIFVGLQAAGLLGLGAKTPDAKTLQARAEGPAPILKKGAEPSPPVLAQAAVNTEMPADVEDWLKHLEKCDQMKEELALKQEADLVKFQHMLSVLGPDMSALNPYDDSDSQSPDKIAANKFEDLKPQWEQLVDYFNSKPPPAECRKIADDYNHALGEIPGMTSDVMDALNAVGTDPAIALEKVNKLKNKSYNDIDVYFDQTDQRVAKICSKYNKRKWFNIKGDVVAGGVLGKLGP